MRAIILAGGKGTRLRPFTTLIPKPLVPISDEKSILEINLQQLAEAGFDRATLAVNHFSHLIQSYFGDGSRFGISLDYSVEDKVLGTMGPLKLIPDLPDSFLVMNGDILTDLDFGSFLSSHKDSGAAFSISSYSRVQKVDFGVLDVKNNLLEGFQEKPELNYEVSMGIYGVNRAVVETIPQDQPFGFDDLMLACLDKSLPVRVSRHEGTWLDIGRPEDYEKANESFAEK